MAAADGIPKSRSTEKGDSLFDARDAEALAVIKNASVRKMYIRVVEFDKENEGIRKRLIELGKHIDANVDLNDYEGALLGSNGQERGNLKDLERLMKLFSLSDEDEASTKEKLPTLGYVCSILFERLQKTAVFLQSLLDRLGEGEVGRLLLDEIKCLQLVRDESLLDASNFTSANGSMSGVSRELAGGSRLQLVDASAKTEMEGSLEEDVRIEEGEGKGRGPEAIRSAQEVLQDACQNFGFQADVRAMCQQIANELAEIGEVMKKTTSDARIVQRSRRRAAVQIKRKAL